jgi:hypothetical protein
MIDGVEDRIGTVSARRISFQLRIIGLFNVYSCYRASCAFCKADRLCAPLLYVKLPKAVILVDTHTRDMIDADEDRIGEYLAAKFCFGYKILACQYLFFS